MVVAGVDAEAGVAVGPGLGEGGAPPIDPVDAPDGDEPGPTVGTPAIDGLAVGPATRLANTPTTTATTTTAPAAKKTRGCIDPRLGRP
jgi:hypothetical protein